jgi:hypothetical protein
VFLQSGKSVHENDREKATVISRNIVIPEKGSEAETKLKSNPFFRNG